MPDCGRSGQELDNNSLTACEFSFDKIKHIFNSKIHHAKQKIKTDTEIKNINVKCCYRNRKYLTLL